MSSSIRQRRQQNLRTALGTVIGFHGYLNNLQATLHRTGYYQFQLIEAMHARLNCYEAELRKQMANIL